MKVEHQILQNGRHPSIAEVLKYGIDSIDMAVDEEYLWSELDYFFIFVFEGYEVYPIWWDVVESQTFGINHLLTLLLAAVVDETKDKISNITDFKVKTISADFDTDTIMITTEKP